MEYRLYEDYQKRKQDLDNFFKKEYEDTRTNNTITKMNEVLDFLTLKIGKTFIPEIQQEMKDRNDLLSETNNYNQSVIENFKTIYLEMEDHFKFTIFTLENKKKNLENYLEAEKVGQENKFNNLQIENRSFCFVNVLQAFNLQSLISDDKGEYAILIQCGIGERSYYKTNYVFIDKGKVLWNETLQIDITELQQSNSKLENAKLTIYLIDKSYDYEPTSYFASCFAEISDIPYDSIKEYHTYMFDRNGVKSQIMIHFKIKKNLTQEQIYNVETFKELTDTNEKIKEFKRKLNDLKINFVYNVKKEKIDEIKKEYVVPTHCLIPRACEEKLEKKVHEFFEFHGCVNWSRYLGYSSLILAFLGLIICFLRADFVDLIIVFGVFIFFTNIPEYTFVMRLWLILLIISWIIDLSWMIIYTGKWIEYYDEALDGGKILIIVFSYISFFYKIFYSLIFWKCSVSVCQSEYFEKEFNNIFAKGKKKQSIMRKESFPRAK